MKYIILFGPPGAGKGTQASAIADKHKLCHISTGELLRKEISEGTELGLKAKQLIDAGSLVPDEIVDAMIEKKFREEKNVEGFLLDGFPRTIEQAKALDKILEKLGHELHSVVSIMIPDHIVKERIQSRAKVEGRADDASEHTINNRIETYHKKTEPLINFYKEANKYKEVDGLGSIDDVKHRIFEVLDK